MSPAHVLEPTFSRLKQNLLSGTWAQDTRLEAQRLADEFGVSMTPVRDCLNRLVGEGLVEMKPGHGYRVPRMTEKGLRDMLDLNRILIEFALDGSDPLPSPRPKRPRRSTYAERARTVFVELAGWSGNWAACDAIARLGDRLFVVRRVEPLLFADAVAEIEAIAHKAHSRDHDLGDAVARYHERRRQRSADLIGLLSGT